MKKKLAICSPNFVQVGKGRFQKTVFAGLLDVSFRKAGGPEKCCLDLKK